METLQAIHRRRSIKKFLKTPVEQDKLGELVNAGRMAPNAGNLQDWRFIIIRNKATIESVARACLHQMWMASAPAMIVIGSKGEKTSYYYKHHKDNFIVQNCAAAAQNIILAATDLGLSSTWVSAFNTDELKSVLGMPGDVNPQVVIPLGYGDEVIPEPPHYKLENLVYLESWGNKLKDVGWVMQDYNIVGRTINKSQGMFFWLKEAINDIFNKAKKDLDKKRESENNNSEELNNIKNKALSNDK